MKKTLAIVLSLVLCIGLLAACGSENTEPSTNPTADTTEPSAAPTQAAEELSGNVNVNGSTSMGDVIAALTEGFNEANPDVTINYTGSGSGAGITGVLDGTCDLGLSSRALTDDEKSQGAVENIIALDGVAVVVNPRTPWPTSPPSRSPRSSPVRSPTGASWAAPTPR